VDFLQEQVGPVLTLYRDKLQASTLESKARRPFDIAALQPEPSSVEKMVSLDPVLFRQLDKNNSGGIDVEELKALFNLDMAHKWAKAERYSPAEQKEALERLFTRADLNGDGVLDIGEFERIKNMAENGDEAAGNKWAQAATKLKLLSRNSPLADGEGAVLVGNKGFDPLGFATSLTTLKAYREAELKHGRLAMLAALGWPVSELLQPVLASKMARISHWQKFSIRWLGMVYTLGHCD
jgi:Ca2+-binding EF-hand superfamily protein